MRGTPIQRLATLIALAVGFSLLSPPSSIAQIFRGGAVGGVIVDADGVLSHPEVAATTELREARQAALAPVPGDLEAYTEFRCVSLRGIEQQLAEAAKTGEPVTESVRYLGGLLRVQYVFLFPKQGDIVLAGPAEGWEIDALGAAVGATTRRPVLLLDDLIVALRSSENANGPGISCSIDPTPEGLARSRKLRLDRNAGPEVAARRLEQAVGQQVITVDGVPETSHFARTLVAADFRMKRLAMGFEPAPVDGLPSYLDLIPQRATVSQSSLPRWWLATNYESLTTDDDGLAWEIRGQGVKCMTEESLVGNAGDLTRTGKAGRFAQDWADRFTDQFNELANHDSSFGHLRNAMDLAVAAAIVSKERAFERTGLEAPQLTSTAEIERYTSPRNVATKATFVRKRGKWIITASGGVQMYPWEVADKSETNGQILEVRSGAAPSQPNRWWW